MKKLLKLLLLSLPISANASGGLASAFYTIDSVDSKDVPALDDDGSGFSASVAYVGSNHVGFYGDYATTRLDESRADVAILRAGASYSYALLPALTVTGKAEVAHVNAVGSDMGFGGHGEISYAHPVFGALFVRGGFIEAGDLSGPEFSVGASFPSTGSLRALVEYRLNTIESDINNAEGDLSSVRLGLGISF